MIYYINKDFVWTEETKELKIAGKTFPVCTDPDWVPEKEKRIGEIAVKGARKKSIETDSVKINRKDFPIHPSKNRFFRKKIGWLAVKTEDGSEGFIKVNKIRPLALLALILIALAILWLILALCTGTNPKDTPAYLAAQAGITNNNKDAKSHIEYASYESTPDTTWKAGEKQQKIILRLPATTQSVSDSGKKTNVKNPVVAAPSIWVDINKDGKFTANECVFNAPSYDKDGNVTNAGQLLKPGNQITKITLSRTLAKGKYTAQTLWTPQMAEGGSPANPMTFKWTLTVK